MGSFLTRHAASLRYLSLAAMMVIPFFLYFAAINGQGGLLKVLLGLMGVVMLLTMKVG